MFWSFMMQLTSGNYRNTDDINILKMYLHNLYKVLFRISPHKFSEIRKISEKKQTIIQNITGKHFLLSVY